MNAKQGGSAYPGSLPVGTQLLHYRIQRVLGVGGFGITYLATDEHLDCLVAIKEYMHRGSTYRHDDLSVRPYSEEFVSSLDLGLERFLDEARTLARFNHPNFVRVNGFFRLNNTAYMVMVYEQGEVLSELLKREQTLDEGYLLDMILPLLDGLALLHDNEIIHRDIKPSNIFLRSNGDPLLLDFGSARNVLQGRQLTVIVSVTYSPIEQLSGEGQQGPWTDIYALGGVLYRAVSGNNPIQAMSRLESQYRSAPDPLTPAVEVGAGRYSLGFLQAIDHALIMDNTKRPQSVQDWAAMLRCGTKTVGKPLQKTSFFQRLLNFFGFAHAEKPGPIEPTSEGSQFRNISRATKFDPKKNFSTQNQLTISVGPEHLRGAQENGNVVTQTQTEMESRVQPTPGTSPSPNNQEQNQFVDHAPALPDLKDETVINSEKIAFIPIWKPPQSSDSPSPCLELAPPRSDAPPADLRPALTLREPSLESVLPEPNSESFLLKQNQEESASQISTLVAEGDGIAEVNVQKPSRSLFGQGKPQKKPPMVKIFDQDRTRKDKPGSQFGPRADGGTVDAPAKLFGVRPQTISFTNHSSTKANGSRPPAGFDLLWDNKATQAFSEKAEKRQKEQDESFAAVRIHQGTPTDNPEDTSVFFGGKKDRKKPQNEISLFGLKKDERR